MGITRDPLGGPGAHTIFRELNTAPYNKVPSCLAVIGVLRTILQGCRGLSPEKVEEHLRKVVMRTRAWREISSPTPFTGWAFGYGGGDLPREGEDDVRGILASRALIDYNLVHFKVDDLWERAGGALCIESEISDWAPKEAARFVISLSIQIAWAHIVLTKLSTEKTRAMLSRLRNPVSWAFATLGYVRTSRAIARGRGDTHVRLPTPRPTSSNPSPWQRELQERLKAYAKGGGLQVPEGKRLIAVEDEFLKTVGANGVVGFLLFLNNLFKVAFVRESRLYGAVRKGPYDYWGWTFMPEGYGLY